MTENLDFVIPIKKIGLFTRAVLESINKFYNPRRIIIITNKKDILFLKSEIINWNVKSYELINEETFFIENFNLTIEHLKMEFQTTTNENHREFGWWLQQIIKIASVSQIPNLSINYIVWDGDLIPLIKWDFIQEKRKEKEKNYFVAILQENAKNEFNKEQYNKCNHFLLGFNCIYPNKGTFIAHHMVFNQNLIKEMLNFIIKKHDIIIPWPLFIISLSKKFYRFSEYNLYSSFINFFYENQFFYHEYDLYGKNGIRFRETEKIIEKIIMICKKSNKKDTLFSFDEIYNFFSSKSPLIPYVQFEHVYF